MKQIILNLNDTDKNLFITEKVMQGENLATELNINLSAEFLGYKYKLVFQNNTLDPFITVELIPVENVIACLIQNTVTKEAGILKVELHAYNDSGLLIKTATTSLRVEETIDGTTEIVSESYVPWYFTAVEQAEIATTKASEASASADIATEQANIALLKVDEIITLNTDLETNISTGNTLNTDLETNILTGQTVKTDLDNAISDGSIPRLLTATFTATVNNTTNIVHNLSYDSVHDDLLVIYSGVLCEVGTNYTENANKISINLVGWYINAGEVIKFKLYKNIK
jgi:hypothetical protein